MSFQNTWEADTQQRWERMLATDNPESIDSISIHIYPSLHDKSYFPEKVSVGELIGICNKTANIEAKPLFVGEFGAPKTMGSQKAKKYFFEILKAIEEHNIPLSAVWVFDFPDQDADWNVTADNEREYMLKAIKKANSRIKQN